MDTRQQFSRIERFRQVIVGAHLQTHDAVDVLALGGQHDDGESRRRCPEAGGRWSTAFAGEHEVEDDQIEVFPRAGAVHLRRVRDSPYLESLFAEIAGEQIPQADVVIDDENAILAFGHGN